MIPYAKTYTATMRARVLKFVVCEQCGCEFVYQMERESSGAGTSMLFLDNAGASKRAENKAEADLRKKLDTECDPVPCMDCGQYQQNMLPGLRAAHRSWMFLLGVLLVFGGVVCFVATSIVRSTVPPALPQTISFLLSSGVGLLIVGLVLVVVRKVLAAGHDPNTGDTEPRKAQGAALAMRKAEFDKIVLERQGPQSDS